MPKLSSECNFGVASATADAMRAGLEAGGETRAKAEEIVASAQRWFFDQGKNSTKQAETTVESVNFGIDAALARSAAVKAADEATLPWYAKTGMAVSGKKGKAIQSNVFNQFSIISAQARITGQVRSWQQKINPKSGADDVLSPDSIKELAVRLRLSDTSLRFMGIPLITVKTALKGDLHASHLTFGDIVGTLQSNGRTSELAAAAFRNSDPEKNVPFQNIAEAVREVIEHSDLQKPTTSEGIAALKADVLNALVNNSGKSSNKKIVAAQEKNRQWMLSDEGQVILDDLAETLTSGGIRSELITENTRQLTMHLAFSRGDGFQMTDQVMKTIMNSPWSGDKVMGFGALLFDNGLQKIFGDDIFVKASIDGSTLAFAEQFLAKTANMLSPESLAVIKNEYGLAKAAREAARVSAKKGKTDRSIMNKTRKKQGDEVGELSGKKAEQDVAMDGNARSIESSIEGAVAAQTFYNELKYGSVVGGLAKALSKVSDKASMSGRGKTILTGIEHRRQENAAIISQATAKMRESFNKAGQDPNDLFNAIKNNLGNTEESMQAFLKGLPENQRQNAIDMIDHIDRLFGVGEHNSLLVNNIFIEDLRKNLIAVGLPKEADNFTGVVHATDALRYWKQFEPTADNDILAIMNKFYTAQQLSMVAPSMADSAARHFSHLADNLSYEDALKQGWKPMNEESTFGKYMVYSEKPVLFPPDILPKLREMESYLNYDRTFGTGKFQQAVRNVDGITSIMKSSLTIWRPGHHMVSAVGNTLFNSLAGVRTWDYGVAVKMMMARGDVTDVDSKLLNELIQANVPVGAKLKEEAQDSIPIVFKGADGKMTQMSLSIQDVLRGADNVAGVPISPRRVRDTVTADYLDQANRRSFFKDNPVSKGVAAVDHQLARAAAARDNVARYALFVKELQKGGPYKNLDDAFLAAGQKVHEFHPTVGTLTGPERKWARRAFYFYTWQKQALFKILETAANAPAVLTMPSKLQYSIATAQGLDPTSFGDPFSAAGIWAAYNENSVYGPQGIDPDWGAYGFKPASPQLDIIDTLFSPIDWKPEDGLWGGIGNLASQSAMTLIGNNASPLFKIPAELLVGARTTTQQEITNIGEYALDQTGLGTLSRIADWTPGGNRSDTKLDPYSFENRDRLWWNWLLGFKKTYYESPAALQSGRQVQIDYWQKTIGAGRYAPKPSIRDVERD